MRRVRAVIVLALVACASRASAQTTDLVFGDWSWRGNDPGSRPSGLGGAYVAIADGVRGADVNPGALPLIPKAELAAGTSNRWAGLAVRLKPAAAPAPPLAANGLPCPDRRPALPWAFAVYGSQAARQNNAIDVVRAPGVGETGTLQWTAEEIGLSVARGLTSHVSLGVTGAWRHLRLDGQSSEVDRTGFALTRLRLAGDSNKARMTVGALAAFGPAHTPTALRLGLAYQRDVVAWSVERTVIDRDAGVVASGPALVQIVEPPVLQAGIAWRLSDVWTVAGQVDYIWYDVVARALARNSGPADASGFALKNGVEPRLGIEMTRPSPLGGYVKLRAGFRLETSGRLEYSGSDTARQQAFRSAPAVFRGAAGASLLAEFYEKAVRLDLDISHVVVERRTSLAAAGTRRFSFGLTVRP